VPGFNGRLVTAVPLVIKLPLSVTVALASMVDASRLMVFIELATVAVRFVALPTVGWLTKATLGTMLQWLRPAWFEPLRLMVNA
jgi:hypothetical protein